MTVPATMPPESPGGRPVWREPSFLRLWSGTTASGLATWALPFVLGLAVLDHALSATGLGVVLAARTAGFLLAVPVAGVLADRYSRRAVVLWAGLAAALATPLIALGLGRSVLLMSAAAVVVGAGQGACRPAFQALTAEVVDAGRRRQANAAITLAVRVTTLVAPAATALLATVLSSWTLIVGTGLLWLLAAILPPPGRRTPAAERAGTPMLAEFGEGVREARRHPWFLAGLAALAAVIFTGYSATAVALPLVGRDRYGTEAVLVSYGLAPVGLAFLAPAVDAFGWQPVLALCALVCFSAPAAAALVPTSRHFSRSERIRV